MDEAHRQHLLSQPSVVALVDQQAAVVRDSFDEHDLDLQEDEHIDAFCLGVSWALGCVAGSLPMHPALMHSLTMKVSTLCELVLDEHKG